MDIADRLWEYLKTNWSKTWFGDFSLAFTFLLYYIVYFMCFSFSFFLFKIIFGFDFLWWVTSGEVYTSLVLFIVLNKYENFQREKIMIVFISLSLSLSLSFCVCKTTAQISLLPKKNKKFNFI